MPIIEVRFKLKKEAKGALCATRTSMRKAKSLNMPLD